MLLRAGSSSKAGHLCRRYFTRSTDSRKTSIWQLTTSLLALQESDPRRDDLSKTKRERDIHRIVDILTRQDESDPRFARIVPLEEIADARNDFNLNLPRYIDSTEPEDLQDIDGHLRGGIPMRDIDDPERLKRYWDVLPTARAVLSQPADRAGYCELRLPISEVKPAIFGHSEFTASRSPAVPCPLTTGIPKRALDGLRRYISEELRGSVSGRRRNDLLEKRAFRGQATEAGGLLGRF